MLGSLSKESNQPMQTWKTDVKIYMLMMMMMMMKMQNPISINIGFPLNYP